MFRSVIALLAGFAIMTFTILVIAILVAVAVGPAAASPTRDYFIGYVVYCTAAAAFGGYSTAALAPSRPGVHAIGLAAMVLTMYAYGLVFPQPGFPRLVHALLVVGGPLGVIVGGKLREMQAKNRAAHTPTGGVP